MVRGKKQKEYLSITEKETLISSRKDLESQLKELDEFGVGTAASQIDKGAIQKQIDRIDTAIADREPPRVSGLKRDQLAKEADDIKAQLVVGMPTREEMNHPAKNPGAVRKHMNWVDRNRLLIERFRTIQHLINPDEPESVEALRKDK